MKKIFLSTLLILLGLLLRPGNVYAVNNMTCTSSLLVDGETGKILFEYNANEIKYPASLTKLMTAIVALEQNNLNDRPSTRQRHLLLMEATLHLNLEKY